MADSMAPYEVFAATGAYNLYTVAPERRRVPLTGGLDLVPDLGFDELRQRLAGRTPDVIVVPAMPDATEPTSLPLREWLAAQSRAGALVLSVCQGARVVAGAGLLDGRDAASHWFRINGLEQQFPKVRWHRGTRYVDDGNVISTGAVLSGIDGALRVIERLQGQQAATAAAAAVGWTHYSAGTPARIPQSTFGPRDMIAGVNLSFRPRPNIGVLVTEGVGELELASVFITYNDASYAARTFALGVDATTPVRSRHGLVLLPREGVLNASNLDRVVVPGSTAGLRRDRGLEAGVRDRLGLPLEYPHTGNEFAFDPVLRDLARNADVPTALWEAKSLEYQTDALQLTGPGWPWGATLLPLLYGLLGLAVVAGAWLVVRRRRAAHPFTPRMTTSGDDGRDPADADSGVNRERADATPAGK